MRVRVVWVPSSCSATVFRQFLPDSSSVCRKLPSSKAWFKNIQFPEVGERVCRRCSPFPQDWVAPSFRADPAQRVVTFKFPGDDGAARSCLFSVLSRFEYFQKALENWQEGASAEVVVTDATTQTFDLLLLYFHTGSLDSELSLESLMGLLELGNKYLLKHLMALCMARILRAPSWMAIFLFIFLSLSCSANQQFLHTRDRMIFNPHGSPVSSAKGG